MELIIDSGVQIYKNKINIFSLVTFRNVIRVISNLHSVLNDQFLWDSGRVRVILFV